MRNRYLPAVLIIPPVIYLFSLYLSIAKLAKDNNEIPDIDPGDPCPFKVGNSSILLAQLNCLIADVYCKLLIVGSPADNLPGSFIKQDCFNPNSAIYGKFLVKEYCSTNSLKHLRTVPTLLKYEGNKEQIENKELEYVTYSFDSSVDLTPEQALINAKHIMLRNVEFLSVSAEMFDRFVFLSPDNEEEKYDNNGMEDDELCSVLDKQEVRKFLGIGFDPKARKAEIEKESSRFPAGSLLGRELKRLPMNLDLLQEECGIDRRTAEIEIDTELQALRERCAIAEDAVTITQCIANSASLSSPFMQDSITQYCQNQDPSCKALTMNAIYCIKPYMEGFVFTVSGELLEQHYIDSRRDAHYTSRIAQGWQSLTEYCRTTPFPSPFFVETYAYSGNPINAFYAPTSKQQSIHLYPHHEEVVNDFSQVSSAARRTVFPSWLTSLFNFGSKSSDDNTPANQPAARTYFQLGINDYLGVIIPTLLHFLPSAPWNKEHALSNSEKDTLTKQQEDLIKLEEAFENTVAFKYQWNNTILPDTARRINNTHIAIHTALRAGKISSSTQAMIEDNNGTIQENINAMTDMKKTIKKAWHHDQRSLRRTNGKDRPRFFYAEQNTSVAANPGESIRMLPESHHYEYVQHHNALR